MEEENHTISRSFTGRPYRGHPRRVIQQVPNEDGRMVGEAIRGVIEAKHEAGYIVSAKLGNSDRIVRGLVFKAGLSIPITVDNDVAPHLPMISRKPSRSQPLPFVGNYVPTDGPMIIRRNNSNVMHHHSPPTGVQNSRVPENHGRGRGRGLGRGRGRGVRALVPNSNQPTHPHIPAHRLVPVALQPVHLHSGGGRVSVSVPVPHTPMQTETGSQAKPSSDEVIHLD